MRRKGRVPVPKAALPDFTPVPLKIKPRHDGWTPERQKAFVEAIADTGCVSVAARMVNMSKRSAYQLRRRPGAESFRKAWDAALGLGIQVLKDEAFERAMTGQLVPVFVGGKLMGFRRKKNDNLLMFVLRHFSQEGAGRRMTIDYVSSRAGAAAQSKARGGSGEGGSGAGSGGGAEAAAGAVAEASTTTVRTTVSGGGGGPGGGAAGEEAARLVEAFAGVPLDAQAQDEIYRALEAAAERRRSLEPERNACGADMAALAEADEECDFVGVAPGDLVYAGELDSGVESDWIEYRPEGEHRWEGLGDGGEAAEIDKVVGEMKARLAAQTPEEREAQEAEHKAAAEAAREKDRKAQRLGARLGGGGGTGRMEEDPALDWRNWREEEE